MQLTPTLVIYETPETIALEWATLVGSPLPIEGVLAKFARDLTNVVTRLEDVPEKPADVPQFAEGQVVASLLRITLENAVPEDVLAAHVTFFVEKSWLKANNIHKWSILVQRFDESTKRWVSTPTKRVRETGERVFYTVALPGFSLFAITGSTELPALKFEVSDLKIEPGEVDLAQKVRISAKVTNITTADEGFTASLWIDDQVEESVAVLVKAKGSERVSFDVLAAVGVHKVRIDRQIGSFEVVLPAIAGDINADSVVDLRDLAILARSFGKRVPPAIAEADINGDRIVDLRDLAILGRNFRPAVVVVGDANADGVVDLRDLAIVSRSFRAVAGEAGYEPGADFNRDGVIDLRDLAMLAANFGS